MFFFYCLMNKKTEFLAIELAVHNEIIVFRIANLGNTFMKLSI